MPGLVLTVSVLLAGVGSLWATSVGLVPLFGEPSWSWDGYAAAAPDLLAGLRESLLIAVPSTVLAVAVGIPVGVRVHRARTRAGGLAQAALSTVLATPHLVGAAGLALLLSGGGLLPRLGGVSSTHWPELVGGRWPVAAVIVFAWKESAFVALAVASTLGERAADLMQAAQMLGATSRQRARTVLIPLLMPGALGAAVAAFVYALGAYEVAWLLGAAYPESLPVMAFRLFGEPDLAVRPQAAVVALVSVAAALVAAGLAMPRLQRLGGAR